MRHSGNCSLLDRMNLCIFPLHAETGSEQFGKFLDLLGDVIQLQDWDRFRGGLDVKSMSNM